MKSLLVIFVWLSVLNVCSVNALPKSSQGTLRGMTVSAQIEADDIRDLGGWGANVVRYPLSWHGSADTADEASYATWLEGALDKFESLLPAFQDAGIGVILNLYTPPGGFSHDFIPPEHRMFREEWAEDAFIDTWKKIALRFQHHPIVIGYDLLNEPATPPALKFQTRWRDLVSQVSRYIKLLDYEKILFIEPRAGDPHFLRKVELADFKDSIYSIHMYYPWTYIHQGVYAVEHAKTYPSARFNRRALQLYLSRVLRFQRRTKARIYVGEFAVARWAPGAALYLRDLLNFFEKHKWDWTYHSFRESDTWNLELPSSKNPVAKASQSDRAKLIHSFLSRNH